MKTDYWKTGHSYIKRRTAELGALAGFEKSGHFFFNPPIGHGYDDGIVAGIQVLRDAGRAPAASNCRRCMTGCRKPGVADHGALLPRRQEIRRGRGDGEANTSAMQQKGEKVCWARRSSSVVTVNGVRVTLEDGTWGLVRASSNKPSLVVVVESPVREKPCAPCSRRSIRCCAPIPKSANTTRRFEGAFSARRCRRRDHTGAQSGGIQYAAALLTDARDTALVKPRDDGLGE